MKESFAISPEKRPPLSVSDSGMIREINRFHEKVREHCTRSGHELSAATGAAWEAGNRLSQMKQLVRERTGSGGWRLWLENHFEGTERTAQRYMLLAKSAPNVSELRGLSLRQAYLKLGIATESKGRERLHPLPEPVLFGNRFRRWMSREGSFSDLSPQQKETLQRDLRPIFDWLRKLFDATGEKSGYSRMK